MEIFIISGYAPNTECEGIRLVNYCCATRKEAESIFSELIEDTQIFGREAEQLKAPWCGNGHWTETRSEVHGSSCLLKKYKCEVSIDLSTEDGLDMFRRYSAVGILNEGNPQISLASGIDIASLYQAMPFKIASLAMYRKEFN